MTLFAAFRRVVGERLYSAAILLQEATAKNSEERSGLTTGRLVSAFTHKPALADHPVAVADRRLIAAAIEAGFTINLSADNGKRSRPHIRVVNLDLSDEESAALIRELADITGNDRYPFSPRIRTLTAILAKLRPEPVREPLPPPKRYAPPRATAARRRRRG
jgi:hypothetical protein